MPVVRHFGLYGMAHRERHIATYSHPKKLSKRDQQGEEDEAPFTIASENRTIHQNYPEILNLSKDADASSLPSTSYYSPYKVTTVTAASSYPPPITTAASNPSDEYYKDECYDAYLQDILCDYGLQLSPGGTKVTEIEQSLSESELKEVTQLQSTSDDEGDSKSSLTATTLPGSKFKKISEVQKSSQSEQHKIDEEASQASSLPPLPELQRLEAESQEEGGPPSKKKRKIGLYMLGPFSDPEQEKKRLNAVNAHKNRVKNKLLTQDLKKKNDRLEHVNVQCSKALKRITGEAKKLQQQIEDKTLERVSLEDELKRKESEVREQREKIALLCGHLDLIADSLDDDNPARKLISTLLNKVPFDTSK